MSTHVHHPKLIAPAFVLDLACRRGFRVSGAPNTEHPGYADLIVSRDEMPVLRLNLPRSGQSGLAGVGVRDTSGVRASIYTASLGRPLQDEISRLTKSSTT